jgi:hypothetical protein
LLHVAEAGDYGWRLAPGARRARTVAVRVAVGGDSAGKMPPLLETGRGSPSGLLIYNGTRFPEAYRGLLIYPDAQRRLVRAYRVEPDGATFKAAEEFKLLEAADLQFRPCQAAAGPDGAIYVVDRRGKGGRIYRLTWAGTKDEPALPRSGMDSWSKIVQLPDADLLKALAREDAGERDCARKELARRGDKNRTALIKLLHDDEQPLVARIAALGALHSLHDDAVQKAFVKAVGEGDAELRKLAADGLGLCAKKRDRAVHNALLQALADENPSVRRSVALAMGRVAAPGAAENLATNLSFDTGKDALLTDGILRGLERLGKPGIAALIALADSGVQKDIDRVADAFTGLRSRAAFDALPGLLKNPHYNDEQRAALVRSCANYQLDPPVSLEPVFAYLAANPKEDAVVRTAGLDLLATPGTVAGPKARQWALAQLADRDAALRRRALHALGATPEGARELARLHLDARLPHASRAEVTAALRRHGATDPGCVRLLAEVVRPR